MRPGSPPSAILQLPEVLPISPGWAGSVAFPLERETANLYLLMVRIYASGYHPGHHNAVVSGYVDIHDN